VEKFISKVCQGRLRFHPGLVSRRLQGRGLASPGDFPASRPQHLLLSGGSSGMDLDQEPLAQAKELQGDAKPKEALQARLQNQRGVQAS
jgi:hypothetical protein